MVDLSPGTVATVVQPSYVANYAAPGIVQGLWLKEGPMGPPASDAAVAAYIANPASATAAALGADWAPIAKVGQNPLTGYFHARAFGDKTRKTSNINLAVQAAVTAGGGTVFVDGGVWTGNQVINMSGIHPLNHSGMGGAVHLKGAGREVTRIKGNESGYGWLEMVGSTGLIIEDMSFEGDGSPTGAISTEQPYGIVVGRPSGNTSHNRFLMRNVYIWGTFTTAGLLVLNMEEASYENVAVYTNKGSGAVFARDTTNWSLTLKHSALSTTAAYSGGNGIIRIDRGTFVTTRNPTAGGGNSDTPLVLEYVGRFTGDSIYTLSAGDKNIIIDKGCGSVSFRGLQQEWWVTGVTGATEPIGVYIKGGYTVDTTIGEQRVVRLSFSASSLYSIYGEDGVQVALTLANNVIFAAQSRNAYSVDVWDGVADVPSDYVSQSNGETMPTYRRRRTTATLAPLRQRDGSAVPNGDFTSVRNGKPVGWESDTPATTTLASDVDGEDYRMTVAYTASQTTRQSQKIRVSAGDVWNTAIIASSAGGGLTFTINLTLYDKAGAALSTVSSSGLSTQNHSTVTPTPQRVALTVPTGTTGAVFAAFSISMFASGTVRLSRFTAARAN